MTPLTHLARRRVALFGLGSSGLDAVAALLAGGAVVAAWDDGEASRARAAAAGVPLVDLAAADWRGFEALVLAPGVPLTHPAPHWTVVLAGEAGVPVIGDIELFGRERAHLASGFAPGSPFVAITGTNGKSTTTALTAHLFRQLGGQVGLDVAMGGNIGTPILRLAPPAPDRVHVVECSSYQIDLAPSLAPTAGVLMNLTPDHLDRHGTMETYAAVKERLVAGAKTAIVSVDDPWCAAIAERLRRSEAGRGRRVEAISVAGNPVADGITLDGTVLLRHRGGEARPLVDLAGIGSLRGAHNAQNAAAAILALEAVAAAVPALRPLVDDRARLEAALRLFPGLAHRMEEVGRVATANGGSVLFVNDSKATNADAAEKALLAFPPLAFPQLTLPRVHWIIGGKAKAGGIEPLRPLFARVARAYGIGQASEAFAATLGDAVPFTPCGTLDVATSRAAAAARAEAERDGSEQVVLLSPACASQDQFSDFEQRGERFRQAVREEL